THDQIMVIPNGVDPDFKPKNNTHVPAHDLVFVGNLGYGPNTSAAQYLVGKLMPELERRGVHLKLLLAGARPGRKILQLNHNKGVTVRGWVEDIRDAYADGRIFVAPMFSGLGLQNKILEAMAMGLPCVTTSMVNNAIGATLNKEILVADTLEGLADHVQRLLKDEKEYERIATAARSFVLSNYQWEDQVEKLEKFISSKNVYADK
ncbi:MAG TPA: glycosyltransferase, partial [Saprospiraceae bacterium]|nr:glycosyltransferase [Saprospiraceae bacterium]